ncbi:xylulose kinase-1, partial [Tanacetum coccineum]
ANTYNMVAFLEKPAESDGFHEIIDFLNGNQIRYALTFNPTIYTSCIEQLWPTAKAKTVNGECQIQDLIDKKKVIITETSIRSDLHLEDTGGTDCLPTATIFKELARIRLRKVGESRRVESSEDKYSLGNYEDASKQGRSIKDIDKDADVSLVDDTQGRSDDAEMFDMNDLHGDEVAVDMPVIKGKKETEESSKGTEDELESDKSKKAKGKKQQQESSKRQRMEDDKETDEHEEVDETELKKHLVIVKDDDIAIDAIPLATKPPVIVEYKLLKEGIMAHYQLIRADGSSKIYSSVIRILQGIDREDLQTLWKLVKTKHGDTRPEDEHERVLWGDLKVMFEQDIKSDEKMKFLLTAFKVYYVLEGPHMGVLTEDEQRKSDQDETLCRGYIMRKNNKGNDKKRKGTWNLSKDNKKDKKPLSEVVCYKCGEKGHIKRYCKNPKKKNQNSNKKDESANAVEQVDTTEITAMVSEMNIGMIQELHMASVTTTTND